MLAPITFTGFAALSVETEKKWLGLDFSARSINFLVLKQDVFKMIPKLDQSFSLIFADPPFGLKGVLELPSLILANNLLKEDGDLIIEHGQETDFSAHPNFREIRKYGGVNFSFFNLA